MNVNVALLLLSIFLGAYQECLPHFNKVTDKLLKHATRGTLTQKRWEKICTTSNVNEWEIVLRYLPELLQAAIKAGKLVSTQILLANCLYHSADISHNQLLKLAASQGHSQILLFLLSCFKYTQHDLNNALISACIENHHQAAEVLLSHGADSNVKMTTGSLLLSIVACKGYTLTMEVLLNHGADPHQNNDIILRELLVETTSNDHLLLGLQTLAQWSKKPTVIPFSSDLSEVILYSLDEPNCISCNKLKSKKVVSLLELCQEIGQRRFNKEINLQFIEQSTTDTFTVEELRSLVEQQADVHAFDDYALRNAVLQENVRAVSVLLCLNLIPTVPPFKQELITELLEFCSQEIANKEQFNAYIQIREKLAFYQNQQKFIDAIQNGAITTAPQLQKLIDEGADVHWNNEWALRWTVIQGNSHMVSLLKRHRPDLTVNNNEPFHLAVAHGHYNLIPLLVNTTIAKKELEDAVHHNNTQKLDALLSWARERFPFPFQMEFITALRICANALEKYQIADSLQQFANYLMLAEIGTSSETTAASTPTRITEETPLHPTASIEQELETRSESVEINLCGER